MKGHAFYLIIGFGASLLIREWSRLGPVGIACFAAIHLASIGMWFFGLRIYLETERDLDTHRIARSFLYMAPIQYALGLFAGGFLKVY